MSGEIVRPGEGSPTAPSAAVAYAALVGRYIRMERAATPAEVAQGDPSTVGMEASVACIDDDGHGCIEIVSHEGFAFLVRPGESWRFTVWADEATRKSFGGIR